MKLADLNPKWLGAGGDGVYTRGPDGELVPAPERHGVGIMLDCPCGCEDRLYVPFREPLDGGPSFEPRGWERAGDTFDTLTLRPSILRDTAKGGCGWHGWITDGEVTSC